MHRRVGNVKTIKLNYIESAVRKEELELIPKLKIKIILLCFAAGCIPTLYYTCK